MLNLDESRLTDFLFLSLHLRETEPEMTAEGSQQKQERGRRHQIKKINVVFKYIPVQKVLKVQIEHKMSTL